jgi:serine/threonine protein kinase, bacterial
MFANLTDILERPIKVGCILKGRYKIIHFIAKGSYGLAYRAIDLPSDQMVLVKQFRKRKCRVRRGLLEREARMLKALDHPAIPKCLDFFEEKEQSFLIMEFLEGQNIEELIFYQRKRFNEKDSFRILLEILPIIQYFHEKGIIHRDLRLPNILIKNKQVFIIDFGLAVFCDEKDPIPYESMPQEKRLFREISFASDFYALGHFVLFLLYSDYQASSLKNRSWEEELNIGNDSKRIIRKLLKLDSCYEHVSEIIKDVEQVLDSN